jgi:hypothetical protein
MQLQRRLAELVLSLDEPRRTVVVLAFYEGKSAAEIGRQLDIPATTVRSRIASALDTMRTTLDGEAGGDRAQWQLALAPLIGAPAPAASGTLVPIVIAAAMIAAITVIVIAWPDDPPPAAPTARPIVTVSSAQPEPSPLTTAAPAPPPPTEHAVSSAAVAKPAAARTGPAAPAAASGSAKKPITEQETFERTGRTLRARIEECWRLALTAGRDIKGLVAATITIETQPDIDATLAFDRDNTVTDPQMLECLRENPLAIVEHVEELRAADPTYPGPITITLKHPLPPPDDHSMPPDWPADDARPACPSGTALAGTYRKLQWCQRADGTKHGPQHEWDATGRLIAVVLFEEGKRKLGTRRESAADR